MDSNNKIYQTLRLAVAMCFIGHGAFGIITKPIWCNYFALAGIGTETAYRIMPIVGTFDILMGISVLIYPLRIFPFWLIFWGIATASLRPLSGEPFPELIERAGNFGAPICLLVICSGVFKKHGEYFQKLQPPANIDAKTLNRLLKYLQVIVFLLLAGHGWLNLLEKKSLLLQYSSLGFPNPANAAHFVGIVELLMAVSVLVRPMRPVILAFFIWKMGTELFYPHYEVFEWVERAGSYGTLLALWFALGIRRDAYSNTNKSGISSGLASSNRPAVS